MNRPFSFGVPIGPEILCLAYAFLIGCSIIALLVWFVMRPPPRK